MPLPPSLTRQNAFYLEDDQINTPLDPVNLFFFCCCIKILTVVRCAPCVLNMQQSMTA
jgi:hypothetical protein